MGKTQQEVPTFRLESVTTYLRFWGGVDPSSGIPQVVTSRDPKRDARRLPPSAIGFDYYDIINMKVVMDGRTIKTRTEPINVSKDFYIDAVLLSLEEVRQLASKRDRVGLLRFMNQRGYTRILRYRGPLNAWSYDGFIGFDPARHELVSSH